MASTQLCALIFADIVRSSDIKSDDLKTKLARTNIGVLERIKADKQVLVAKNTGDGFFICGSDVAEMAEAALMIRDTYRNTDWKRFGFADNLKIRVALDLQKVNLVAEDGRTIDVTGQGVDRAARIEPIVAPNEVWCSDRFATQLAHEHISNIVSQKLGSKPLAKGAGDEFISELRWVSEAPKSPPETDTPSRQMPGPRIPRRINRQEMDKFIEEGFSCVRTYFKDTLASLQSADHSHVSYRLKDFGEAKFTADVYVDGECAARCKVWLAGDGNEIRYSSGRYDINEDNSYNEAIHVNNDGVEIFLQAIGMSMMSGAKDKLLLDDVGKHVWSLFESSFPRQTMR